MCSVTSLNLSIVFYLDYLHFELHFISVGMQHQILTKQAYFGEFFCSNWLNVLGPSLPESALYYDIFCRGTKTIQGYVYAKDICYYILHFFHCAKCRAGPGHRQYRQVLGAPSSAGGAEIGGRKKINKKINKK